FRKMPNDWELQHSFLLAMALHYHADRFSEGCYALDSVAEHELMQHPWGNCSALMNAFTTKRLPLKAFGELLSRADRAEMIANYDPALLPNISVCWVDTSTGQNCGRCNKCHRTRALFDRIGAATDDMFLTPAAPLRAENLKIPRGSDVRMAASLVTSWVEAIEDGSDDHILLQSQLRKLRRNYVRLMPYR
ncbi:MAG: hypothetical protein IIX61_04200, partial [Loktanella sp.]|nr:hypothetical protein [Loktanella sp.]